MKVILFYSDGLIGNIIINAIVPQLIENGMTPVLIKNQAMPSKRTSIAGLKEISTLESGILQEVIEPFFDIQKIDQKKYYPYKQLIQKYDLEFHDVVDINSPDFISYLESDKKIIGGISIRFYQKFKPEIIKTLNKSGFLWNLHTGLLPHYKGVFIPYRALENKEKYYGWTLHHVDQTIDTGDIIASDQLPLNQKKPILNTYLDMTEKGAAMIMGALVSYNKNKILKGSPQKEDATYYTFPTQSEMIKWNTEGFIFSKNIAQTYADFFTKKGSEQETQMTKAINQYLLLKNIKIDSQKMAA